MGEAEKFGERVEIKHSHSTIADKLRKSENRIIRSAASGETLEELSQLVDAHTKRLEYTKILVKTLYETLQKVIWTEWRIAHIVYVFLIVSNLKAAFIAQLSLRVNGPVEAAHVSTNAVHV